MTTPITPEEAGHTKGGLIPDEVMAVFNSLIAQNYDGRQAVVRQDDAVRLIVERMSCTREDVFSRRYLDVEALFEAAGWKVDYDKPGYCEAYAATFTFKKRGK
jgi:hypothetical protein